MTLRERLLWSALVAALAALTGVFLWQQARYTDAQEAIRRFVRLEQQLEPGGTREAAGNGATSGAGQPADDPDQEARLALVRQARPELRRALAAGTFRDALRRLDALDQENAEPDPETAGKAVAIEALWPDKSPDRARAREVLRLLVERLRQGYDVADAQDTLVTVAEKARAGKRDEALAAFAEVERKVREARMRPGFQTASARNGEKAGGAVDPGAAAAGAAVNAAQVQQMLHVFRVVLPQAIAQAPPDQQAVLRRLEPIGSTFERAVRDGKDVTQAVRIARRAGNAIQAGDLDRADRLIAALELSLKNAPKLPAGKAGLPSAGDAQTARSGAAPGSPVSPAPKLPAVGTIGSPATPGRPGVEQLLQAMDGIRRLPEPTYQQQRIGLATFVLQAMGGARRQRPPAMLVGPDGGLQLVLGERGEFKGLWSGGKAFAPSLEPGGAFVRLGNRELPLAGDLKPAPGKVVSWTATGPEGSVTVTLRPVGTGFGMEIKAKRSQPGGPGRVALRIPISAGGWRWVAGSDEQVIAVDGSYSRPGGEAPMSPTFLRGAGVAVSVQSPSAAEVSYRPQAGALLLEFDLPASGERTHSATLSLSKGGGT